MRFVSFDIRIGSAGIKRIESKQIQFHKDATGVLFPTSGSPVRLGIENTLNIDHYEYVHNPGCLNNQLLESIRNYNPELCLIDFTSNLFVSVRDPLLLAIGNAVLDSLKNGLCNKFLILLPNLPGPKSPAVKLFEGIQKEMYQDEYTVLMVAPDHCQLFNLSTYEVPKIGSKYTDLMDHLYGSPAAKLERKCIQRLGHFQTYYPDKAVSKCRIYSYYFEDCDKEFYSLFTEWWQQFGNDSNVIMYDLKNNSSLKNAMLAFCDKNSIICERIVDVLEDEAIVRTISQAGKSVLVLDVVESGSTLKYYIDRLNTKGIRIHKNILTAINKGGTERTNVGEYIVQGLLSKRSDSVDECGQCKLYLPITPDSHEIYPKLRALDIFHMIKNAGWEEEPKEEVPDNIGLGYRIVPKFSNIIRDFGDWIAYKLNFLLKSQNCPDDWFVIHPEEAYSGAMSDKLQLQFDNKLTVIKIPRNLIREVQRMENAWEKISHSGQFWAEQLDSIGSAGGLILDIYNASGSTCRSLYSLMSYFNKNPFAYICLIDFDPQGIYSWPNGLRKLSLYDWYNPRELLIKSPGELPLNQ